METFSALLAICAGNSPVAGEFPAQRPVTRSFDVFFDRRLNKRLSKQSWGWWFETLSRPLWRHCNVWFHPIAIRMKWLYNHIMSVASMKFPESCFLLWLHCSLWNFEDREHLLLHFIIIIDSEIISYFFNRSWNNGMLMSCYVLMARISNYINSVYVMQLIIHVLTSLQGVDEQLHSTDLHRCNYLSMPMLV